MVLWQCKRAEPRGLLQENRERFGKDYVPGLSVEQELFHCNSLHWVSSAFELCWGNLFRRVLIAKFSHYFIQTLHAGNAVVTLFN